MTDYGIYPEPLVPVLNANGYGGDVFYGDYDPTELMQQLALGRPVVVWLAMWGDTGVGYEDEGTLHRLRRRARHDRLRVRPRRRLPLRPGLRCNQVHRLGDIPLDVGRQRRHDLAVYPN